MAQYIFMIILTFAAGFSVHIIYNRIRASLTMKEFIVNGITYTLPDEIIDGISVLSIAVNILGCNYAESANLNSSDVIETAINQAKLLNDPETYRE